VLESYPVKSIRDIYPLLGFFTRSTITVSGEKMSLNALEKDILIKRFQEPRVHAAINCASRSCPELLNEANVASKLEAQLTGSFKIFVNPSFLRKTWNPHETWGVAAKALQNRVGIKN
jgi:hypothetical protein